MDVKGCLMRFWLGWLVATAFSLASLPGIANAAASEWVRNDQSQVRLVSAVTGTGDARELRLGLQVKLQPGWKVYWRSAGDAGYPPKVEWYSDDIAATRMDWPLPHRFEILGLQSFGYAGEVIYPVTATLKQAGQAFAATAKVDYLTCSEICVPQQAQLSLSLPAGPADPSPHAHDINRFAAAVPGDGAGHGLSLAKVETMGDGDAARLRVTVLAEPPLQRPDLFVESADNIQFKAPQVRLENGGRRAILDAEVVPSTGSGSLSDKVLTVTIGEGARGLERQVTPVAAVLAAGAGKPSLLLMAAFALLGGLILNLMPCVLPVLSIKVLGLIGHGGGERRHIRVSFIASSLGILASFLLLAGTAVAVKAAGLAVGWGIQFQQPLFLVFLTVVVTLFAANLWGLFEVPMPWWLSGVGAGHGNPRSLAGHFLTGAFATLLATPCTAPFLGTAVGFALSQGAIEIFTIFAALGIGMALPYLAVAAWPGLAQRLPRPGAWMVVVRKVMGLALAATAVWLLSVLAAQTGMVAAALVGSLMAGVVVLLAARVRLRGFGRGAAVLGVAVLAALAFVPPLRATSTDLKGAAAAGDAVWVAFDRAAIDRLVASGKRVLVDVTADWCITCQVNKAAVINRGDVAALLEQPDVVAMRADWTSPDAAIADYLASHGRYGIPFNIVYGPGAPAGIALPELLTTDAVIDAFAKAAPLTKEAAAD